MAEKNNANIGFEKQIWDAACVLWGHIPAAEYRKVIVGLIFLRYISSAFEKRYNELVSDGDGFEDDRDAYAMENVFFVPEQARWETIAKAAHTPQIGEVIDNAMRAIEAENRTLKNVLPKNYSKGAKCFVINIVKRTDAKPKVNIGNTVVQIPYLIDSETGQITEPNRRNLFVYYLPITEQWQSKVMSERTSENGSKLQMRDEYYMPLYVQHTDENNPRLSHSEFWKQRGGLTSYSDLQEDFYIQISKRYGAKRGESYSLIKNTNPQQQERFDRQDGDLYDELYFDDSPY